MSALWKVPLAAAAVLLLVAGIVLGLGDRQVLTAPPESVAEQFMRKLQTERYDVAMDQLSDDLRQQVSPRDLMEATQRLKQRVGQVQDVRGEPGPVRGDTAEATAVLQDQHGREVPVRFRLQWSQGAWAIADLGELSPRRHASAGGAG